MMEAGRSLDALIAEKVMGWKHRPATESSPEAFFDLKSQRGYYLGTDTSLDLPHYSTSIAAAWEVVEKLTYNSDRSFKLDRCCDYPAPYEQPQLYIAHFSRGISKGASTAAHAICLAALSTLDIK